MAEFVFGGNGESHSERCWPWSCRQPYTGYRGGKVQRRPDLMAWLRAGVPVTLVIDLLDPRGPDSSAILVTEGRRRPTGASEPWISALIGHVADQFELPAADVL